MEGKSNQQAALSDHHQPEDMEDSIHGFWTIKPEWIPGEDDFIVISSSRYVEFLTIEKGPPPKRIVVRLWCDPLGDGTFRVRLDPNKEGWKLSMWRDRQDLMIHNGIREFRCLRVPESAVPDRVRAGLIKAYEKMDSLETKE